MSQFIQEASCRGWSDDVLCPSVSALSVIGVYTLQVPAADGHRGVALPLRDPLSGHAKLSSKEGPATTGVPAAAAAATEQTADWIECAAKATASGCVALVMARTRLLNAAGVRRVKEVGVIPPPDELHYPSLAAACCLTLAEFLSGQATRAPALREKAGHAILAGLQFSAQISDSVEVASLLVPCCSALASTCLLAPLPGSSSRGEGGASGRRCCKRDKKQRAQEAERNRPDFSVRESAAHLRASIRESWNCVCRQLNTR